MNTKTNMNHIEFGAWMKMIYNWGRIHINPGESVYYEQPSELKRTKWKVACITFVNEKNKSWTSDFH